MEFSTTHQIASASHPKPINGLRDENREKQAVTVEVGPHAAAFYLGRHPVTSRTGRMIRRGVLCSLVALVGTVLFLGATLLPLKRYVPICGSEDTHVLHGPMREQYVALLAQAMALDGFRYYRNGNTILVPLWPLFDGQRHMNWENFQLNFPWRMAANIAEGVQIGPHFYRPPAPVLQLLGVVGPWGPYPRQKEGSSAQYGPNYRFVEDCNLFRAAVLKVEAMPSEALPDLNAIDRARHARTEPRPAPRP